MSKTRIKTEAAATVFQTREEVDAAIAQIGHAQRERAAIAVAMNAELAAVRDRYEQAAAPHAAVIKEFGHGVQIWAEAHRAELTRDGKTKTAKLASGEISWRTRPPKVRIIGEEWLPDSDVLTPTAKLKRRGIHARYADHIEELYT